jgi:hypothetical protein
MGKGNPYRYVKNQKNSLNQCKGFDCLAWIKEAGKPFAGETISNAMERIHKNSKAKRKKTGYSYFVIFLSYLGILKGTLDEHQNTTRRSRTHSPVLGAVVGSGK